MRGYHWFIKKKRTNSIKKEELEEISPVKTNYCQINSLIFAAAK